MFGSFQTFGRMGAAGRPWSERALWPSGASSPGLWIDPGYVASCYQDSAGTTALSTVGTVLDSSNPVGLVLDRKGGLQISATELVSNGGFDNNTTGWTAQNAASLSSVSGELQITSAGTGFPLAISSGAGFATTTGKRYRVTGVARRGTCANPARIRISGIFGVSTTSTANTAIQFDFVATGVNRYVELLINGASSAGETAYFDSISVREIPGLHLSQSTSAARPVASARKNLTQKSSFNFSSTAFPVTSGGNSGGVNLITFSGGAGTYILQNGATGGLLAGVTYTASAVISSGTKSGTIKLGNQSDNTYTTITPTSTPTRYSKTFTPTGANHYIGFLNGDENLGTVVVTDFQIELGAAFTQYQRINSDSDYDATGFPVYTKFDGTDDALASATFSAGTLTSSMDCLIAVRRDSSAGAILGPHMSNGSSPYAGAAESGGSYQACLNAGSPTIWVDGVQLSGGTSVTAGTLHTAVAAGAWHILEFRGMNLSAWTQISYGGFSGYFLNGALGEIQLFASGQDTNRDKARARMAAYYGVTLP